MLDLKVDICHLHNQLLVYAFTARGSFGYITVTRHSVEKQG